MVSVIIPCYNRKTTINIAIDSVINQKTTRDLEIIVSDDGSTDGTLDFLREKYHDKIIIVTSQNENIHGASAARNRGLDMVHGEYVCFLDSDDYYLPDFIEKMASQLDTNEEIGYVFCRCLKQDSRTGNCTNWTKEQLNYLERTYHVAYSAKCINTISIMARRSVINKVGHFDTTLKTGEDSDMWIRISEVSNGLFLDYPLSVYCYDSADNKLTTLSSEEKRSNGRSVHLKSLLRCNINNNMDIVRRIINYRSIIILSITDKQGVFFSIARKLYVGLCTICLFPKSCILFYLKKIKK